jgi:hypothetical protein
LRANEHRHETQAGTAAQHRQTNTGTRRATVIAPAFSQALKVHFQAQNTATENTGTQHRHNSGANTGTTVAETPAHESVPPFTATDDASSTLSATNEMRLAVVYERLLKSKDDQIESLSTRVEALEESLKREQENTARAQTLQAMKPQVLAAYNAPEAEFRSQNVAEDKEVPADTGARNMEAQTPPRPLHDRDKIGLRGFLLRLLKG